MAVAASLVATFADIDLEDGDASRTERENSGLIKAKIERWRSGRLIEKAKLFSRRGEGVAPAKQRESHLTAAFLRGNR
jgi:hypothetical protein